MFWILVAAGGILGAFESSKDSLFSIYANLLINIFLIIDLFISDHETHKFSWITMGFILLYDFCYMIIIVVCRDNNIYTYEFLKNISSWGLFGYGILFVGFSLGSYFIHILILQAKYKYIIKNKEKQDFNDEVNKIIQMSDLSKISTEDEIE
jgi:hypothetical protein